MGIYLRNGVFGMKPKFLLSGGTNFSASTPFFYTLAVDQQYCHTGHMKEMHYLHLTESGWDGYRERLTAIPITNRDDEKKPPMLKQWRWDTSEMSEYFQPPFTIEKYIKYHLHHWEYIKDDYQSCGDFSNSNGALPESFLIELESRLSEHFDVKCVMMLRDPIRRLFSMQSNNVRFQNMIKKTDFSISHDAHPLFRKIPNIYPYKYQMHRLFSDYTTMCKRWKKVWGDRFYPVIMEEFWEDPSGLSEFLDYPITKLSPNVFWPENQSNPIKHEFLQDQWRAQKENISDVSLKMAKRRMKPIYDDFKEYMGYLPEAWHET